MSEVRCVPSGIWNLKKYLLIRKGRWYSTDTIIASTMKKRRFFSRPFNPNLMASIEMKSSRFMQINII